MFIESQKRKVYVEILALIFFIFIAIVVKDGWKAPIILIIMAIIYFSFIKGPMDRSKYRSLRVTYDNKVKNYKPFVNEDLTDASKQKAYDEYVVTPQDMFTNTDQGREMFKNIKEACGYPKGAIPDSDNYGNDYVVGEVIELPDIDPKFMRNHILYNNVVYNIDGSYYKAECLGKRFPTLDTVKMYGYGGTEVTHTGIRWRTIDSILVEEKMKRMPNYVR